MRVGQPCPHECSPQGNLGSRPMEPLSSPPSLSSSSPPSSHVPSLPEGGKEEEGEEEAGGDYRGPETEWRTHH